MSLRRQEERKEMDAATYLKAKELERKISKRKAEKRAGKAVIAIIAITCVCAIMINLDSTLQEIGNLGV
jgi:hypothetical protein